MHNVNVDHWIQHIIKACDIKPTEIHEEDDLTDAGFAWVADGREFSVQITPYDPKPFLLHEWVEAEGHMVCLASVATTTELIEAIDKL